MVGGSSVIGFPLVIAVYEWDMQRIKPGPQGWHTSALTNELIEMRKSINNCHKRLTRFAHTIKQIHTGIMLTVYYKFLLKRVLALRVRHMRTQFLVPSSTLIFRNCVCNANANVSPQPPFCLKHGSNMLHTYTRVSHFSHFSSNCYAPKICHSLW